MLKKESIKRNLLGSLEFALFMPDGRKRFGNSFDDVVESFIVAILLFPLSLVFVYFYPKPEMAGASAHGLALLYSLRIAAVWGIFFGTVYLIAENINRKEHFYQFIVASNWLVVPSTVLFFPVLVMLETGLYSWSELYPFIVCLIMYSYVFTGYMIAKTLRIPWELAGFITVIGMLIDEKTLNLVYWVGDKI